jgi:predicted transcriptional regulator
MAMTVHLDDEASAALSRVAKARGQAPEAVAKEAILEMVAEEEELLAFIEEGERDLREGRVHSEAEVRQFLAEMRQRAEAEIERRKLPS